MVAIDALPSESDVSDKHSALAVELDSFNKEALELISEIAAINEENLRFGAIGLAIERDAARIDELSDAQVSALIEACKQSEVIATAFKARYDDFVVRSAAHAKRAKELEPKLKAIGVDMLAVSVGPKPEPFSNN
jgi:hypothetical protein